MDFNIVTFHTAFNYGAVLQALALQEFIKEIGYSAGVYNYNPHASIGEGFKGRIYKLLRKLNEKDNLEKEKRFIEFRNKYLNLNTSMNSKVFLSGSDQVWNPTGSMNPIYYLKFVGDNSVRASYAASMGVSKVPDSRKELFKRYIEQFDCISVREKEVEQCLSEFDIKDISVNVDPTLLMNAEFWEKYMRKVPEIDDDYILVYFLHLPKNGNQLVKWLKKETGKKVVLIGGTTSYFVYNDKVLHNIGPGEFLWLVYNAKSVVTSSFHGTAFSIIFQKEFYSVVNPNMPSRINNILNLFGLQPVNEIDTLNDFKRNVFIDWKKVSDILSLERQKSKNYLNSVYALSQTEFRKPLKGTVKLMNQICTGCSACESICPVDAIKMVLNNEGFYEPRIDENKCVNCSKCLKTCPLNKNDGNFKEAAYYGWNKNPIVRYNSSSGGIFRAVADDVLDKGGIVFGAVYSDDWKSVVFDNTDNISIEKIQKSKYTVSNPSGVYPKVKQELENGRYVMLSGTPCQNAGLTRYLGKEYDNLIKCDFVCGGMASLNFYQEYLDYISKKCNSSIQSIDFRPKDRGWGKQRIKIKFKNNKTYEKRSHLDYYFKCFANEHVSVRKTCLDCEYYSKHVSDITLADFWGYKAANVNKNKEGLSLIIVNTDKGKEYIEACNKIELFKIDLAFSEYATKYKSPNVLKLKQRDEFFQAADQIGFINAAEKMYKVSEFSHIKAYLKSKLKR